jgi:plasmid maintenance system antidote protein VapI
MPDAAWLFAETFGISPEFWLNLQTKYDLVRYRPKRQVARIAVTV